MNRKTNSHSRSTQRQPWTLLILLCVAQFMVIVDVTVVNVALPAISESLHFARSDLQWVVTAYVLFTGALLLLGGRASDLFGRRRIFLIGMSIFTLASLASGLAPSPAALIAARAAQGLGAAMLIPGALAIVTTTYVGDQRTAALAAWGAIGSAGAAAGVVLGGVLTSWLGWQWVFLINVPIGLVTMLLAFRMLSRRPVAPHWRGRLDLPGAISAVTGLVVLVFAIEGTGTHAWASAHTVVLLALCAALLVVFAAIERKASDPLVPPSTWRIRSLVCGIGVMFGATAVLVGTFYLNSIYLQQVLGYSALRTGLAFLPLTVVIGLGAHSASRFLPRIGSRPVAAAGLALIACGALLLVAAPDHASYGVDLLPGFLILGLGVGFVFPAASVTTMSEVHDDIAGRASGLMSAGHEIGAAVGVATFSAMATTTSTFTDGYAQAFGAAAAGAAVLAAAVLVAVPSVRPRSNEHLAMH